MDKKQTIFEYRNYLKKRYGEVLQRVPIDSGSNCPNRKADGSGGCSFCAENGGRAPQLKDITDIAEQIDAGVRFARGRYGKCGLMAYLQAYTATFTSTRQLRSLINNVLDYQQFRAITIGTRPDCLSTETIMLLQETTKRIDMWVELGIQTSHDATLKKINRGHNWHCSKEAILQLHEAGINIAGHLILGLPGEGLQEMQTTMLRLAELPLQAIKLHNLHILRNTQLAAEYIATPFHLYTEHQYAELLLELLPLIPADRPLIRLTTDSPEEQLFAPHWSMSKGTFLKFLKKQLVNRGISQGMALRGIDTTPSVKHPLDGDSFESITTHDGSTTFYSQEFKEHFHTLAGARSEAEEKYCIPAQLKRRLKESNQPVRILDICFGLGYNSLVACEYALALEAELTITALEIKERLVTEAAHAVTEATTSFNWQKCLITLAETGIWEFRGCSINMLWGDARHTIEQVPCDFDLIWLDGFSTQRNSELWTVDFFQRLAPLLVRDGALLTYCAAIPVRKGMLEAGFHVGESAPFGRSRGGTVACHNPALLPLPLPKRDIFLMGGSRGIPYRDPDLTRSNRQILRARQEEILKYKKKCAQKK